MKKATAFLVTALGIIALTGAGCNKPEEVVNPNEEKETATSETTTQPTEEVTSTSEVAGDITVSATALGDGLVSVSWTVPDNFDKTKSFRVMHSSRPNPSMTAGDTPDSKLPFWFQYMNSTRSTELSNVATGTRYFRVCAYDLEKNECSSYSNEIELQVK